MNGTTKTEHLTAQVPADDLRRLEEIADSNDRNRSAELRRAIREYIERHEVTGEKAAA